MSKYWSSIVGGLKPYVPGEQPKIANLIKLNTNENPYGPSPKVIEAIRAEADDRLRLYPDPDSSRLKQAIADLHQIPAEMVFVGNGSDEVLAEVFLGLLKHDRPLLYPDISYSFYPVYCGLYDIKAIEVPLTADYRIALADYRQEAGAIILSNPNAPTGVALPLSEIEALLRDCPDRVVVIDEAYVDFGGESAVALTRTYPNLLVVQTFSKSRSLAGLRAGFAIGHKDLIEALKRVKDSFNSYPLDRLAEAGAAAAIRDGDWFESCRQKVIASRERLVSALEARGFAVLPSAANFIFARHASRSGAALQAALRERAVLVRHFNKPRLSDFLRISIGTDAECDALVAALDDILAKAD